MRNSIAKSFSDLYSVTHEIDKRISPRRLRLAYDYIKDFRNICAHDERLFCARVSPSHDVNLIGVLSDLELVLTCPTFVFLGKLLATIKVRALRGALFANVVSAASFPHFSELIMQIA